MCVLGRKGPADPPMSAGIRYGAVLIPLADHERNWGLRQDGRRPHPSRAEFSDLEVKRDELRRYANEYLIPVFDSFAGAIEALVAAPVSESSAPPPPRVRAL